MYLLQERSEIYHLDYPYLPGITKTVDNEQKELSDYLFDNLELKKNDEVITQALTFVATANAIAYNSAHPVFLDVDFDTMGLSPKAVSDFLDEFGQLRDDGCYNKSTGRKISACLPMHTFGFPVHLNALMTVCSKWNIPVVEDAAESIGSEYNEQPTSSFGKLGVFSFNGNKIVTSGGGGAIVTNDIELGLKAKHLTTTAKVPHPYEYVHDEIGFNYRMGGLEGASLGVKIKYIDSWNNRRKEIASMYKNQINNKMQEINDILHTELAAGSSLENAIIKAKSLLLYQDI